MADGNDIAGGLMQSLQNAMSSMNAAVGGAGIIVAIGLLIVLWPKRSK